VEILIVGTIEVQPQHRAALLEAVRPYVERTRGDEPGCLDYAFMEPVRDAEGRYRADFAAETHP